MNPTTKEAAMAATTTELPIDITASCIRCDQEFIIAEFISGVGYSPWGQCSRCPGTEKRHEQRPPYMVRPGSSLHSAGCQRALFFMDLPDTVRCTCGAVDDDPYDGMPTEWEISGLGTMGLPL